MANTSTKGDAYEKASNDMKAIDGLGLQLESGLEDDQVPRVIETTHYACANKVLSRKERVALAPLVNQCLRTNDHRVKEDYDMDGVKQELEHFQSQDTVFLIQIMAI